MALSQEEIEIIATQLHACQCALTEAINESEENVLSQKMRALYDQLTDSNDVARVLAVIKTLEDNRLENTAKDLELIENELKKLKSGWLSETFNTAKIRELEVKRNTLKSLLCRNDRQIVEGFTNAIEAEKKAKTDALKESTTGSVTIADLATAAQETLNTAFTTLLTNTTASTNSAQTPSTLLSRQRSDIVGEEWLTQIAHSIAKLENEIKILESPPPVVDFIAKRRKHLVNIQSLLDLPPIPSQKHRLLKILANLRDQSAISATILPLYPSKRAATLPKKKQRQKQSSSKIVYIGPPLPSTADKTLLSRSTIIYATPIANNNAESSNRESIESLPMISSNNPCPVVEIISPEQQAQQEIAQAHNKEAQQSLDEYYDKLAQIAASIFEKESLIKAYENGAQESTAAEIEHHRAYLASLRSTVSLMPAGGRVDVDQELQKLRGTETKSTISRHQEKKQKRRKKFSQDLVWDKKYIAAKIKKYHDNPAKLHPTQELSHANGNESKSSSFFLSDLLSNNTNLASSSIKSTHSSVSELELATKLNWQNRRVSRQPTDEGIIPIELPTDIEDETIASFFHRFKALKQHLALLKKRDVNEKKVTKQELDKLDNEISNYFEKKQDLKGNIHFLIKRVTYENNFLTKISSPVQEKLKATAVAAYYEGVSLNYVTEHLTNEEADYCINEIAYDNFYEPVPRKRLPLIYYEYTYEDKQILINRYKALKQHLFLIPGQEKIYFLDIANKLAKLKCSIFHIIAREEKEIPNEKLILNEIDGDNFEFINEFSSPQRENLRALVDRYFIGEELDSISKNLSENEYKFLRNQICYEEFYKKPQQPKLVTPESDAHKTSEEADNIVKDENKEQDNYSIVTPLGLTKQEFSFFQDDERSISSTCSSLSASPYFHVDSQYNTFPTDVNTVYTYSDNEGGPIAAAFEPTQQTVALLMDPLTNAYFTDYFSLTILANNTLSSTYFTLLQEIDEEIRKIFNLPLRFDEQLLSCQPITGNAEYVLSLLQQNINIQEKRAILEFHRNALRSFHNEDYFIANSFAGAQSLMNKAIKGILDYQQNCKFTPGGGKRAQLYLLGLQSPNVGIGFKLAFLLSLLRNPRGKSLKKRVLILIKGDKYKNLAPENLSHMICDMIMALHNSTLPVKLQGFYKKPLNTELLLHQVAEPITQIANGVMRDLVVTHRDILLQAKTLGEFVNDINHKIPGRKTNEKPDKSAANEAFVKIEVTAGLNYRELSPGALGKLINLEHNKTKFTQGLNQYQRLIMIKFIEEISAIQTIIDKVINGIDHYLKPAVSTTLSTLFHREAINTSGKARANFYKDLLNAETLGFDFKLALILSLFKNYKGTSLKDKIRMSLTNNNLSHGPDMQVLITETEKMLENISSSNFIPDCCQVFTEEVATVDIRFKTGEPNPFYDQTIKEIIDAANNQKLTAQGFITGYEQIKLYSATI